MICLWYRTVIRGCLVWARGNNQDDGADNGRQTLIWLRGRDAIGDAALREADYAVTLHAHAEKTSEPT
jgi:hypothetical protein